MQFYDVNYFILLVFFIVINLSKILTLKQFESFIPSQSLHQLHLFTHYSHPISTPATQHPSLNYTQNMQGEIIERTPSVYFKFDDESHRNLSKSSFAFEYSISNQKNVFSNNLINRIRNQTGLKQNQSISPLNSVRGSPHNQTFTRQITEDQFMALYGCKRVLSSRMNTHSKLQTEAFFDQFEKKYDITFQYENQVHVNEWIPEADEEDGSGISKNNLVFEEFPVEQTMMPIRIHIETRNQMEMTHMPDSLDGSIVQNMVSFTQTNDIVFLSQLSLTNGHQKTDNEGFDSHGLATSQIEEFSSGKQDSPKNPETECQETGSSGLTSKNYGRLKKYRPLNSRHFATKDFQNNSSLLQKNRSVLETKRRVPLKSIQNIIHKQEKQQLRTRKKPIINTDLLVSTLNRTDKSHQSKRTTGVWSNPINNKKSSSLDSSFTYNNVFKTNAFRETLKSTTLENWRKKYHKKIEHLGDVKTVTKKHRDVNIFNNLFLRA